MIEIYEPGSAEHHKRRAEQELAAARAATFLMARSVHFEMAVAHLESMRAGGARVAGPDDLKSALSSVLCTTFMPQDDETFADLLDMLDGFRGTEKMDDLPDLLQLSDKELIELYCSKEPDDPDVDRIANVMEERGIDYPPECPDAR